MVNIFNNLTIPYDFSSKIFMTKYFKKDLFDYLDDNLDKENIETFTSDLENALTINANGKYI